MARQTDIMKLAFKTPDCRIIDCDAKDYRMNFQRGVYYAQYAIDSKQLKKEAVAYVKNNGVDIDTSVLQKATDSKFESIGKFCYLINNGAKLTESEVVSINKALQDIATKVLEKAEETPDEEPTQKKPATNKPGIQDYMREKAAEVCGEFEGMFDEYCANPGKYKLDTNIKGILVSNQLKAGHLRYVIGYYTPMVEELTEVLSGEDKELREAYSFLTKPQVKKLLLFVQDIVDTATFLKSASVTAKKPRKKKAIDVNKLASKVKYKKEEGKVKSVNPVHVVGAKGVWVYNTKTRKIGYYEAFDDSGLTLKGSAIKNFSEKSVERTVRKGSKFDIEKFVSANKSTRKRQYKELSSIETRMKGRMNEHVLILAVDK